MFKSLGSLFNLVEVRQLSGNSTRLFRLVTLRMILRFSCWEFIKASKIGIDAIVPMPASNFRSVQPVLQITNALGKKLGVPVLEECLSKTKKTPQLKDVYNYEERTKLLEGAFTVNRGQSAGKSLLLFDDLYRSGATMNAVARELAKAGDAKEVSVLALTHTRSSL